MCRKYWSNPSSGKTWEEFLKNGGNIDGFEKHKNNRKTLEHEDVRQDNYFIYYIKGIKRFIAVFRVSSKSYYYSEIRIFEDKLYPFRFNVEEVYKLTAKTAIPLESLKDKPPLSKYTKGDPRSNPNYIHSSLCKIESDHAEQIIQAIADATVNPIEREFDERKYWQPPKAY